MYTFYLPKVKASGKATISIVAKTGQQLNHTHKLKHTFATHNQTNMLRQENTYKTIYTYKAFIIHLVIEQYFFNPQSYAYTPYIQMPSIYLVHDPNNLLVKTIFFDVKVVIEYVVKI